MQPKNDSSLNSEQKNALVELCKVITDDLKIDKFNIQDEVVRTPNLFSKYLSIYNEEKVKLRHMEKRYKDVYITRREYYLGRWPDDKYTIESPRLDKAVLRQDVDKILEGDSVMQSYKDKMFYQEHIIDIIERTLIEIKQRSYYLRIIQDNLRFESGQ